MIIINIYCLRYECNLCSGKKKLQDGEMPSNKHCRHQGSDFVSNGDITFKSEYIRLILVNANCVLQNGMAKEFPWTLPSLPTQPTSPIPCTRLEHLLECMMLHEHIL